MRWCPNRRVPWRHAFAGAFAAALAFEGAKHGFAVYVKNVPTYELVYGTLAALPVFLIWIYVCWLIVLAGAAITATLTLAADAAPGTARAMAARRGRRAPGPGRIPQAMNADRRDRRARPGNGSSLAESRPPRYIAGSFSHRSVPPCGPSFKQRAGRSGR